MSTRSKNSRARRAGPAAEAARRVRREAPRAPVRTRRRRPGRGRRCAAKRRTGGAAVDPAAGSTPASAASSGSQSRTARAIGPRWSKVGASGTIPRSETSPRVGLIVDVPHSAEGIRSEPAVSVPVATGTWPEASAAPEPPLEPPAERSSDQGLPTWSVVPPHANSCVCRWPSSTMPAAESARPGVAVPVGHLVEHPARGRERLPGDGVEVFEADRDPAERGCVACRKPLVGPVRRRDRVLLVDAHPRVDRAGSPSWLCVPSRSRMRPRHASTSSREDSARFRSSPAASSTPRSAGSLTARSSHDEADR